ncbi:MAG: PD-(D/E)XK nuclease family protein [Microcoleaceae cyanobacterium]
MTLLRISQQQLNLLATCPRKFQQTYLEQLTSPLPPEEEARLNWGSQFHLLIQQRELGLPIDLILETNPELQQCLNQFIKAAPEIFNADFESETQWQTQIFREPEHQRSLKFQNYLLTVIYDLLIAEVDQAKIFDWKTYPRPRTPQDQKYLAQNWQTRLYLYTLVETSDYSPEQISMTYWFIPPKPNYFPESLKFFYTVQHHQKTHEDLVELLQRLEQYLADYERGQAFPQVSLTQGLCQSCQFASRCQRTSESEDLTPSSLNSLPDFARIKEVPI